MTFTGGEIAFNPLKDLFGGEQTACRYVRVSTLYQIA